MKKHLSQDTGLSLRALISGDVSVMPCRGMCGLVEARIAYC